eukprot:scaffold17875_cov63-Attheya_sp.AAC.2
MKDRTLPETVFCSSHGIICNDELHVINACSSNQVPSWDNTKSYNNLDYGSSFTVRPLSPQQPILPDYEREYYFDPSDEYVVRVLRNEHGDRQAYTRESYVEAMLANLLDDELFGREIEFNSLDYALVQARRLLSNDYDFDTDKDLSFKLYPDDDGDVFFTSEPYDSQSIFTAPHEAYTGSDYGDVDVHTHLLQSSPSKIDYNAI